MGRNHPPGLHTPLLAELARCIEDRLNGTGAPFEELRPGLLIARIVEPTPPTVAVYPCSLCVVAQGRKRVRVGDHVHYGAGQFLVSSVDLPAESEVIDASEAEPMVGLGLTLDVMHLATVAAELNLQTAPSRLRRSLLNAYPIGRSLAMVLLRLVEAARSEREWAMLSPGLLREVYFRLLTGPAQMALVERIQRSGDVAQIARVIDFIKHRMGENLDVETLAKIAGLSTSGLHVKFKEMTSLSPIQFLKRLRLDTARTMILSGESVTHASLAVGYASLSQFSRDFKRHYGMPPSKAVALQGP